MINEWRVGQFKSVGDKQSLAFRPLTVLTGPNSSGKSTVIQSILLVAQTLNSKVSQRRLVLNGDILKLGTFDDLLNEKAQLNQILIGFSLQVKTSQRQARRRSYAHPLFIRSSYYFYESFSDELTVSADLFFGPSVGQDGGKETKSLSLQVQLDAADFSVRPVIPEKPESPHPPEERFSIRRNVEELNQVRNSIAEGKRNVGQKNLDDMINTALSLIRAIYLRRCGGVDDLLLMMQIL